MSDGVGQVYKCCPCKKKYENVNLSTFQAIQSA